jgi:hypothetical protein
MGRAFEIDVAAIGFERMLKKARSDRARLDQRHIDGSPFELDTKRVGESLDGEFRGAIGATVRGRDKAKHGRAEHETPAAIRSHRRNHTRGEVMPAEHCHLELGTEHIGL